MFHSIRLVHLRASLSSAKQAALERKLGIGIGIGEIGNTCCWDVSFRHFIEEFFQLYSALAAMRSSSWCVKLVQLASSKLTNALPSADALILTKVAVYLP